MESVSVRNMTTHSIHNSGESALDCLIAELQISSSAETGVRSGKNAKLEPDVSVVPTGKAHAIGIEVKKTGKSVPQMRPLSYKPHAIRQAPGPGRAAK